MRLCIIHPDGKIKSHRIRNTQAGPLWAGEISSIKKLKLNKLLIIIISMGSTLCDPHTFQADLLKSFQEPCKAGTLTVPVIPTKKLRLREVKELARGLPASKRQLGFEAR